MTNDEIEFFIDNEIKQNEVIITAAAIALLRKIRRLLNSFDVKRNGRLYSVSKSLPQKNAIKKEIDKALFEYLQLIAPTFDYSKIDGMVQENYNGKYIASAGLALVAFIQSLRNTQAALADSVSAKIDDVLVKGVVASEEIDSIEEEVENIIVGVEEMSGTTMMANAKAISLDSMLVYFAMASDSIRIKSDSDRFRYFGNLIPTSRPWCINHKDKIFTRKEIKAFDNDSWAGKKPGPTIFNRGGYNCRHQWILLIDD